MKEILKHVFYIYLLLLLISCSNEIIQPKNVDISRAIKSNFKDELSNTTSAEYKNSLFLKNILKRINNKNYGDKNYINLIIINNLVESNIATTDKDILISKAFIDEFLNFFNENDFFAVLCHESSHILNEDWKIMLRNSYSKYGFTSKIFISGLVANNDEKSKEVKIPIKNYKKFYGFPPEVEFRADRDAEICLKEFSINYDLINTLNKTINFAKIDETSKENLRKRIRNISMRRKQRK